MSETPITFPISEIFLTVQGEGLSVGCPAIFIRFGGCNLTCHWCDTKYTWDGKLYNLKEEITRMTLSEILTQVKQLTSGLAKPPILVLTGGEPLLQPHLKLRTLLLELLPYYSHVEVETNGTIRPSDEITSFVNHWNVSPKLPSAQTRALDNLFFEYPRVVPHDMYSVKFVVVNHNDFPFIRVFSKRVGIPAGNIIIQPEATTVQELIKKSLDFYPEVIRNGWRLGTRLHIFLWGDAKGT